MWAPISFSLRWGGLIFTVFWTLFLFVIGLIDTLPNLEDGLLHPYVPINYRVFCYCLGFIVVPMILYSLYLFQKEERRNRLIYWINNPYIVEAMQEPLENVHEYRTALSPEEIRSKTVFLLCPECNKETIPRSHHCNICNVCVIRRDHHCFVTSGCIGIGNQRFFINSAIWCALGCLLFIVLHGVRHVKACNAMWQPILEQYGAELRKADELLNTIYLSVDGPVIPVLFCAVSIKSVNMTYTFILLISIICCGISATFAIEQLFVCATGWTFFELKRKNVARRDGRNVFERMRLLFGRHWYINWIFPNYYDDPVLTKEIAFNLVRPKNKRD